jgi:hypothetical protein
MDSASRNVACRRAEIGGRCVREMAEMVEDNLRGC